MLQTQVNYWDLQEKIRHNQMTEEQAKKELAETNRANQVREFQNEMSILETKLHNRATEMNEQARILNDRLSIIETKRANQARETLTKEQNAIQSAYNIESLRIAADRQKADQKYQESQVEQKSQELTIRSNEVFNSKVANEIRQAELDFDKTKFNVDTGFKLVDAVVKGARLIFQD